MTTAGAAAAAIAEATKASGVIIHMEAEQFQQLLHRVPEPLVVVAEGGAFRKKFQYLTSHRGLAFFTESREQLQLPGGGEVISAKRIWVP